MVQNIVALLAFLDSSKAFDIVDHGIVCDKFKNTFNTLSQTVLNGDVKSVSSPVRRGVPQALIFGPLLYRTYCIRMILLLVLLTAHYTYLPMTSNST